MDKNVPPDLFLAALIRILLFLSPNLINLCHVFHQQIHHLGEAGSHFQAHLINGYVVV